jgi:hypothetical protein
VLIRGSIIKTKPQPESFVYCPLSHGKYSRWVVGITHLGKPLERNVVLIWVKGYEKTAEKQTPPEEVNSE